MIDNNRYSAPLRLLYGEVKFAWHNKRKVKRRLFFFFLLLTVQIVFAQNVKTVFVPDEIKVEDKTAKEIVVANLADVEIYRAVEIHVVDDFLYFLNRKPNEIVKTTLQGKTVQRNQNYGRGPGEFIQLFGLRAYKGNIVVGDASSRKVILYSKNLEFIREFKLNHQFLNFFINKNHEFVFFDESNLDRYFWVYNEKGKFLRKFGEPTTPRKRTETLFDSVKYLQYIPEQDGIWACFKNRYDLRYYQKEKWVVEIKAEKDFFKWKEEKTMGIKWKRYIDRPVHLARDNERLFYFYRKDGHIFGDFFDLTNYQLRRRVKFKMNYRSITHYKGSTFYALGYDDNEDGYVLLFKLKI